MCLEILAAALAALVSVFVAAIRARVVGCSRQVSRPYRRQNCGFYGEQIPSERAVHSMEHEAVWITPGLRRLRDLADSYVLVSPFANLPSPVVASAWGRQLRLDSVSDPRLDAFIQAFRQALQTSEPGTRCTGGAGSPD